jgi:adenine/guanine phosphoribosyltransferase-like PRPP-binding protein
MQRTPAPSAILNISTLTREELNYLNAENKSQVIELAKASRWRIIMTVVVAGFLLTKIFPSEPGVSVIRVLTN